jgi:hypothetical protein
MMIRSTMKILTITRLIPVLVATFAVLSGVPAHAAVPGIGDTTPGKSLTFNLTARADYTSQPDGQGIYSWGYSCSGGKNPEFQPFGGACPNIQIPGPTLIVAEGDTVTVNLSNSLPAAAGNTSILFAGFSVTASGGAAGVLTREATPTITNGTTTMPGTPVSYTFIATKPGTYAYYSGSRPDLQVEMGLFGAIIVYPAKTTAQLGCATSVPQSNDQPSYPGAAYNHALSCFDREYLFQFSEMMLSVHQQAEAQVQANAPTINVVTEPYLPSYFLVNGRSMPDDMDAPYSLSYPNQPYNGNPHMHPGEKVLMRVIGQGRYQHPFHHHGNHIRVLARDGNLLLASDGTSLAGPLLFTVPTVSGQSLDGIFTWTGQGLNWDVYGPNSAHACNAISATLPFDRTTYEYCPDHGKPFPITAADPNIVANGLWYGGSPYLGDGGPGLPPGADGVNPGSGYAYMWHSHDEREITTNDVFPGGMMMMLIIDAPCRVTKPACVSAIDEKQ